MKRLLIVTEDVVKIQTYSGFLGRLYSRGYIGWLKLRTKLAALLLARFYRVTVLVSSDIGISGKNKLYYGDELAKVDYARDRDWYCQVTNTLLMGLPGIGLFKTRLTIYLAYYYLIYCQVYDRLLDLLRPDRIVVMGQSFHEQIVAASARKRHLPVTAVNWFGLFWLQIWLQNWLLDREYKTKLKNFFRQMNQPRVRVKPLPVLLSADFYRHLKTLVPLYRRLQKQGQASCLVTDIGNLQPTLESLYLHQPQVIHLPAYFPKNRQPEINQWQTKFNSLKSGRFDWLESLCWQAAEPIIKNSLLLSRLYSIAAENLFKKLKPKGVAVVSDLRFGELALTAAAKKFRRPSVMASPNTMMDLTGINPYRSADKVAVVGRYIKKQLAGIGVPVKKIFVTGDLVRENITETDHRFNRNKVFEILGIPRQKKLVLAISFRPTWMIPKEEKEAFIRMSAAAAEQVPGAHLVIKPHPTEKRYRVREELNDWGIKNAVVSDNNQISLLDLLAASNVVLQTWSFTVFEAIMVNRPVIVINPFKKNYNNFLPIINRGGAVEVSDLRSLQRWLKILIDRRQPQTIKQLARARRGSEEFIHFSKGEASGTVVKLLLGR